MGTQPRSEQESSREINAPLDRVWSNLMTHLSNGFVVINATDKQNGFLSLSSHGDPEQIVDCGRVKMQNAFRTIEFDVASNKWQQPTVTRQEVVFLRINVFLKPISSTKTKMSVLAHYSMLENFEMHSIDGMFGTNQLHQTAADFDSGGKAKFGIYSCIPTGLLETKFLDLGSAVETETND